MRHPASPGLLFDGAWTGDEGKLLQSVSERTLIGGMYAAAS
jgi:hypothetical protein